MQGLLPTCLEHFWEAFFSPQLFTTDTALCLGSWIWKLSGTRGLKALMQGVTRRLDNDGQKGTQKACREPMDLASLYYHFNNMNKRDLGMQSIACTYATCSRNDSKCLLQNITLARIHKGSNEKLVFSLPSFCSQAWQRMCLNWRRWYNLWGVLNRSEEDCRISFVTFIFIFLDRLTLSNNLNHKLLYFFLFYPITLRSWIWNST